MKIIGITGPSGAGKSYLSGFLRKKNIPVLDADEIYHSLLVPPSDCLDAIRSAFGDGVIREDGSLDRRALSSLVFGNEEKLELLNSTVLGFVLDRVRQIFSDHEREGAAIVGVDAPTLIESGFYAECDTVISVLACRDTRIARIIMRDGITEEAASARVDAQRADSFYIEKSDIVMENNGSTMAFDEECERIYSILNRYEEC
jgi:dephospho-CoA kinase